MTPERIVSFVGPDHQPPMAQRKGLDLRFGVLEGARAPTVRSLRDTGGLVEQPCTPNDIRRSTLPDQGHPRETEESEASAKLPTGGRGWMRHLGYTSLTRLVSAEKNYKSQR